MGDSSDENHVLYIKKFVKQVLAEVKRKQDDALAETCTYVTRVLGRVTEIIGGKSVRIDDGTGVMDVELLTLKVADSGDADYAKEGVIVSGAKESQGGDPKRVRYNKGPTKFSKAINSQHSNFGKPSLIGENTALPKIGQLVDIIGVYEEGSQRFKASSFCVLDNPNCESLRIFEILSSANTGPISATNLHNKVTFIHVNKDGTIAGQNRDERMLSWENKKRKAATCGENIDQLLEGLSSNDFADMSQG